ncbi:patatin-like phospholipase family protein [Catellatospora sp. TT07R-123]|uniref:patatin-like phospholipase family protein n=1 Tax=Catellatospora sp. TT07R-123 TaxID=2733863 RepID=UPI001BB4111E|nr:patatin-like phospholipase family protein [Catellatospora sp. TT07R-123]
MKSRALVLGGGGITGIAWELGILAGLAEAGLDLSDADLLIGTSAGSVVASLFTGRTPIEERYATQLEDPADEVADRLSTWMLLGYGWAMLRSRQPEQYRARLGALAFANARMTPDERRAVIASRLPDLDWPERPLMITASDAHTGEFVVFDRDSGVPLLDAVTASCAVPGVWPPAQINGRSFIDGGMRSATNADLAAGYERVVIVAPVTVGGGLVSSAARHAVDLRAEGAQVSLVSPDRSARTAIGRNMLDPAKRAVSALAGRAQAATIIAEVAAVWGR